MNKQSVKTFYIYTPETKSFTRMYFTSNESKQSSISSTDEINKSVISTLTRFNDD